MKGLLIAILLGLMLLTAAGGALVFELRRRNLSWQWLLYGFALVPIAALIALPLAGFVAFYVAALCVGAVRWHNHEITIGGAVGAKAASRKSPRDRRRDFAAKAPLRNFELIEDQALIVGVDNQGLPMRLPYSTKKKGIHSLVIGKTGFGKTVTKAYIATQSILDGKGAIVIDPKGDWDMRESLRVAAERAGKRFIEWSPDGPSAYNPYKFGGPTEIVDKALAAEQWTEPHYLRQAQRFLNWQVQAMQAAEITVDPDTFTHYMTRANLMPLAPALGAKAQQLRDYLQGIDTRKEEQLGGVRDRLAILSESDIGPWLTPKPGIPELDLRLIVANGDVAYIQLDGDRFPEASKMLGSALVTDISTIVGELNSKHFVQPTLVMIDEFAAVGAYEVVRIFGRGRSCGFSLVLGTQSFSDFDEIDPTRTLVDKVLDGVSGIVIHLQTIPESAERLSQIAGTEEVWSTTFKTSAVIKALPTGDGTKSRAREFIVHPDTLKSLAVGEAVIVGFGIPQRPAVTSMFQAETAFQAHAKRAA